MTAAIVTPASDPAAFALVMFAVALTVACLVGAWWLEARDARRRADRRAHIDRLIRFHSPTSYVPPSRQERM